jgi:hypothetical protein
MAAAPRMFSVRRSPFYFEEIWALILENVVGRVARCAASAAYCTGAFGSMRLNYALGSADTEAGDTNEIAVLAANPSTA